MKNFSENALNSIQSKRYFDLQEKILNEYYKYTNQKNNIFKKFFFKKINNKLNSFECEKVINYFKKHESICYHVPINNKKKFKYFDHIKNESSYSSYDSKYNLNCREILKIASDKDVLKNVQNFIGNSPKIYSINTFWTFPQKKKLLTHNYHRDPDDFRFLTLFIYWTPTKNKDGGQSIIKNTSFYDNFKYVPIWKKILVLIKKKKLMTFSNLIKFKDGYFLDEKDYIFLFKKNIKTIIANQGDIAILNTNNLHKGSPCVKPRLVTWIRYGLYKNFIYKEDNLNKVMIDDLNHDCRKTIKKNYELFQLLIKK